MEASATQQASVDSSAAGFIQISDVDPTGKYVQIKNMSNQVCVSQLELFRDHSVIDSE